MSARIDIQLSDNAQRVLQRRDHAFMATLPLHGRLWLFGKLTLYLPEDVASARRLVALCWDRFTGYDGENRSMVHRTFNRAILNICQGLGIPDVLKPFPATEPMHLFSAVWDNPGDLASWSAYSDWLQEHNEPRGLVIANWLNPLVRPRKQKVRSSS